MSYLYSRGTMVLTTIVFVLLCGTGCTRGPVGLYEVEKRTVTFAEHDGKPLQMDIMMPKGAETRRPLVIWWHGGGWALGNRKPMLPLVEVTASFGYVSATADYRLTTKDLRFPTPLHDVAAALRYLRSHADEYNIDPNKIVVGGESAGAHLALLVALVKDPELLGTEPYGDVSTDVMGVVNVYGPTDLPQLYESKIALTCKALKILMGGVPKDNLAAWKKASPIQYVTASAPPTLIVHGDADDFVPDNQAKLYYDRCREVGAYCELALVPHASHGWVAINASNSYKISLPLIMHFLGRIFHEPMIPAAQPKLKAVSHPK